MIDLCTVVFRDEVQSLHVQAKSIDRWVQDVGNIYVVVNDTADVASLIDPGHWGRWQQHLRILHREIWCNHWSANGWVSQQALKLACAALSQNFHCVVLDAKTIFVKPLPVVTAQGRLAVGTLPVYPVFDASRQIVNDLWNIDLQQQLGPGGVPFWFDPHQVRAMIADIESRTKHMFVEWFQQQGLLTEFLLYSGWIERTQGIDNVVSENKISVCNLCHSEVAMADKKLEQMQQSHTVSIHRHAWIELTDQQRKIFSDLITERLQ